MKKGTALITGASSGIGQALALEHAKLGWNLILIARREAELESTKNQCLQMHADLQIKTLVADVAKPDFIDLLKKQTEAMTDLKLVYVNAGVGCAGRFEKLTMLDYKRVFDINVMGALQTVYGTFAGLKNSQGRIVLIASLNSYYALPLGAPYNMTKYAIRALGETLDAELVNSGIKISTVYPGPVQTEILATDNKGRFNAKNKELFAIKGALPADLAAKRIIRNVQCQRRFFSLAVSTSFMIWFQQRFPKTVACITRTVFKRFEKKFVSMIGRMNPDAV